MCVFISFTPHFHLYTVYVPPIAALVHSISAGGAAHNSRDKLALHLVRSTTQLTVYPARSEPYTTCMRFDIIRLFVYLEPSGCGVIPDAPEWPQGQ